MTSSERTSRMRNFFFHSSVMHADKRHCRGARFQTRSELEQSQTHNRAAERKNAADNHANENKKSQDSVDQSARHFRKGARRTRKKRLCREHLLTGLGSKKVR